MISIGPGYIFNHIVSTKLAIDITFLSSYFVISNYPVTGSIMVTALRFKMYLFLFLIIVLGPISYKHRLFHGISSSNLSDNFISFYI